MFGQKRDTGGIPIQSCDTAEGIGNPLRGIIPQHAICQRLLIMVDGRMNRHIGRLVNDQNIFIFIQNGEQHFVWHNIVGAFVFFYADMKGVSDMERFVYITPDAVF